MDGGLSLSPAIIDGALGARRGEGTGGACCQTVRRRVIHYLTSAKITLMFGERRQEEGVQKPIRPPVSWSDMALRLPQIVVVGSRWDAHMHRWCLEWRRETLTVCLDRIAERKLGKWMDRERTANTKVLQMGWPSAI